MHAHTRTHTHTHTHTHSCTYTPTHSYNQTLTHIRNKYTTKKEDTHTIGTHAVRNTYNRHTCTKKHTHIHVHTLCMHTATQSSKKHAHVCTLLSAWLSEMRQLGWPGLPHLLQQFFAYINLELPQDLTRLVGR